MKNKNRRWMWEQVIGILVQDEVFVFLFIKELTIDKENNDKNINVV